MSTASPYVIPVHDIMHKAGAMREFKLDIEVPSALGDAIAAIRRLGAALGSPPAIMV